MHFHYWVKFVSVPRRKKTSDQKLKNINNKDHYNTIAPQTDFEKNFLLDFPLFSSIQLLLQSKIFC